MAPTTARLEHVNITVTDARAMAAELERLFAWHTRWEGAVTGGYSVHVGTDDDYVALYSPAGVELSVPTRYEQVGGFNHLGVVVDDLDATEARVVAAGYAPHHHADYEPGKRFYFMGPEGIEIEVVAYD